MNDIVIEMLRFGKERLNSGLKMAEIITYLETRGFSLSNSQETADSFFNKYFEIRSNSLFYLKPQGYFDLLQIENTLESRKQAKTATTIAIISIVLAIMAIIVPGFLTSNELDLKTNAQLDSIIQYQKSHQKILVQIENNKFFYKEIKDKIDSLINEQKETTKHLNCVEQNTAAIKNYIKPKEIISLKK